jgi:hypothetical protein
LDVKAGYPSRLWDAVFYTCSLLALLYTAVYIYALCKRATLPRWCADFHPRPEETNRGRAVYHVLTTVFLLGSYVALGFAPAYLFFAAAEDRWQVPAVWAVAVALFLLATALHTAFRFAHWSAGILVALLGTAVAGFGWYTLLQPESLNRRLFRAERSVDLLSGVSPSLPVVLLFLALAYWAWVNMQRFIFVEERDTGAIELGTLKKDVLDRINRPLHGPVFAGSWWRGGAILLVVASSGYVGRLDRHA